MSRSLLILSTFTVLFITTARANPPLQLEEEPGLPSRKPGFGVFEAINPEYRLNGTFIPSHYDLELLVILDDDPSIGTQYTAPGKVTIDAKPKDSTNQITLHSYLVTIDYASVQVTNPAQPSQIIGVTGVTNETDDGVQFLTISLDTVLDANEVYQIYIEFVAPISRDILNGLYLSTYTDPGTGEQKRLAATQMESTHARKLFPCFDEPALKATFDVTITRKNNYTALANNNLISTVADPLRPGWSIDTFNTTVPMPTYLFALLVSDFTYSEADSSLFGGKPVRVYAEPHMISRGGGDYAAETSAKLLQFYDDYFQAPYPLAKMDMASVPQFGAGAMENYGLNLYSTSLLMYYPGETTEASRNSITSVLAHELGHQNFGDLVTCNWWTQIWLNEGFATYVANLGVQAVNPEFLSREDTIGQLQGSMPVDQSDISHPLQNNVPPTAVDSHVGTITYDKGGSVNRMTEKFLTEQTFQKGLRYYLQSMKYQAVHSDDLFRNLDIAAAADNRLPVGVSVKAILDSWTLQKGHPLVRVSVAGTNSISISQEKYAHLDNNPASLWYVPVTVVTEDKPTLVNNVPEVWLSNTTSTMTYSHDPSKWIMVNQDATGYYRVLYDAELTNLIRNQLEANASVISPLSRSQLLDDYFTMVFRGNATIQSALNLTTYLAQEDHFAVFNVIFKHLQTPYKFLKTKLETFGNFVLYMLPRLEPALLKVGVEQSTEDRGMSVMHRSRLLDWSCSMGSELCADYSRKLFAEWQSNPSMTPVPLDIRSILHCAIVFNGNTAEFDFTFERYKEAPTGSAMKSYLLNALGCSANTTLLQNLLEKTVDTTSGLARSDATTAIQRVALNSLFGANLVMGFLEDRLSDIISVIGDGSPSPVASVISTMSSYANQQEDLDYLTEFINTNSAVLEPVNNSLQGSLNTIRSNIQWMNDFGNDIVTWLNNMK